MLTCIQVVYGSGTTNVNARYAGLTWTLASSIAGPAKLATASEVATIQYCVWKNL
jgi:hypothetical protein